MEGVVYWFCGFGSLLCVALEFFCPWVPEYLGMKFVQVIVGINCTGNSVCAQKTHKQNSRCSPRMHRLCKILTTILFYVALCKELGEK